MPPPSSQGTPAACDDRLDGGQVPRLALAGTVQIDQVQLPAPEADPVPGHGGRVLAEDRLLLVISLPEADAFPPPQVDRRPDFHPFHAPARGRANRRNR